MARSLVLAAAIAASLLAVSGAGGTDTQIPKRGGAVVVAWSASQPPCLNWWMPTCRLTGDWLGLIDEALQAPYEPGQREWRPVLAAGTTLTTEPPFTVTLHLRPQARWSDGKPVVASDVLFSFRMWLKVGGLPPNHPYRTVVRDIVALDNKTVRAVLRTRVFVSPGDAPRPLPRHVIKSENFAQVWSDRIDDPRTGRPIGNGPFLVASWDKGRRLTLVRNARYWGRHSAYLDRLEFRFVSDPGDALRRGEVDLIGASPAEQDAALTLARQKVDGIKVITTPGTALEHFDIRVGPGGHPALENKLVRRAIAYGIDRAALVRALYGDVAADMPPHDNMLFLRSERYYEPHWSVYRYRPTQAQRLLEQAGCRRGADGIYSCSGERLLLRFVTTAGSPRRQQTLQIVQAELRRVGVEVVPSYAPRAAFFGTLLRGDYDLALFAWGQAFPGDFNAPYGCGDPNNVSGYCSRLVTRDLEQLGRIVDPARRAAVANRADRRLASDVPVIPIYQLPRFTAFRETLHGVAPNVFGSLTWNAEDWWLDD